MNDPQGKVAFITGAASGIGRALAHAFLAAGMKVVLADIRSDELSKLEGLPDENQVLLLPLDVTDREAMEEAAEETERVFGGVDVLCNNAGVNLFGPMSQASQDEWDWIFEVNLKGVVNGLSSFLPRIKARGPGGHILNTASIAAFLGSSKAGIYAASKAAVCSLSESLWYELAPLGIGVSVLCPGLVNSEIYRSSELYPGARSAEVPEARLKEIHALGMDPEEVAQVALQGMLKNEFYIFSHPEHKLEFQERFQTISEAFPDGEVPAKRLGFEESRRQRELELRKSGTEKLNGLQTE